MPVVLVLQHCRSDLSHKIILYGLAERSLRHHPINLYDLDVVQRSRYTEVVIPLYQSHWTGVPSLCLCSSISSIAVLELSYQILGA